MNYRQTVRSVATLADRRGISWTSRFDDGVEAKYQSELIGKTLNYWRFTLVFGAGLVLLFAIWDDSFFPQNERQLFVVRLLIVAPILMGAVVLSFRSRMTNGHLIQKSLVTATWYTGMGVTAMMAFAAKPLAFYVFFPGVMMAFIYMAALIVAGLYVLIGGFILLITYIGLALVIGMPREILGMSLFFLIGTYSVAVFGSYEMERFKRREFLARMESDRLLLEVVAEKRQVDLANAAKSRFLAAASHDLRQPVQAISNFVAVLKAENKDRAAGYLIGRVEASLQSLDNLFLALLDISRLDACQVEPTLTSFSINGPFDVIKSEFASVAADKGLRLRVRTSALVVRSDVNLIERILRNLINNALIYTHAGRVLIGCRRRRGSVAVQVWDTGVGIAEEHRDLVFQEFYQIDNPERDRRKGLGLGLSIVKRLCNLLGHELRLGSMSSKGSMFEILIPLIESAPDAPNASVATTVDANVLAGTVVLLIEDDKEVRESYALLLASWRCFAIPAGSASDALERVRDSQRFPDLIVADFRLREQATGAEAIRQVRADCGVEIPGILITGDTAPERIVEARNSGFRLFHKPLAAHQLRDALLNALELGA